jgi:hypothetical protein
MSLASLLAARLSWTSRRRYKTWAVPSCVEPHSAQSQCPTRSIDTKDDWRYLAMSLESVWLLGCLGTLLIPVWLFLLVDTTTFAWIVVGNAHDPQHSNCLASQDVEWVAPCWYCVYCCVHCLVNTHLVVLLANQSNDTTTLPSIVVSNAHDPHQTSCLAHWDLERVVTTAHGETRNSGRASWRESGALASLYMSSVTRCYYVKYFIFFTTVLSLAKWSGGHIWAPDFQFSFLAFLERFYMIDH